MEETSIEKEKEITKQLEAKARIAEANVRIAETDLIAEKAESHAILKQAQARIAEAEVKKQQILLEKLQIKRLSDTFVKKNVIDIDKLVEFYFLGFPLHRPYVYWQTLRNFRAESDEKTLKNAIKQNDIKKYMRWQVFPPKIKK